MWKEVGVKKPNADAWNYSTVVATGKSKTVSETRKNLIMFFKGAK